MKNNFLEGVGFTRGESKVYQALLKKGVSSVSPLVTDSEISRSKIYEILDRLIAKGLVSMVTEDGVKKYKAIDPRFIPDYLDDQKADIEKRKQEFLVQLPSILASLQDITPEQTVEVFQGWNGVKNMFTRLLADACKNDKWYAFGIPKQVAEERARFFTHWREKTDSIGVKQYIVANKNIRGSAELAPHSSYSHIRYISEETPTSIDIFKKYTLFGVWSQKPILIVITGEAIAKSFRIYFDHVWARAKL